jgi:misacylated tRNA(Ala) deacylase
MAETIRLYLQENLISQTPAKITKIRGSEIAFDQSPFYPGGGGQPCDEGHIFLENAAVLKVVSVNADKEGIIWHTVEQQLPSDLINTVVQLKIDEKRRMALTRYHTVLHVLNTIALQDYGAWITGVQIGVEYSRIDFKFENFSPQIVSELEEKVNHVLSENHIIKAYFISETEFNSRPDLLRTLTVKPPVNNGQVRVVEIVGFDTQACGGTHVHKTNDLGKFSIFRTDNKGKINKRLYIRLD